MSRKASKKTAVVQALIFGAFIIALFVISWLQPEDRQTRPSTSTSSATSSQSPIDRGRCLKETESCTEDCNDTFERKGGFSWNPTPQDLANESEFARCNDGCFDKKDRCLRDCPTCWEYWHEAS